MSVISLLRLSKYILSSNFKRRPFPYKLTFAVTNRCNSRCITCSIWKKESHNELKLNEIEKFFTNSNKFSWIDLTGGEIFLRDDIIEIFTIILKHCKNLYLLHFPTNGQLPDRILNTVTNIESSSHNKIIVTVSLDGPKDLHDKLRGVKGSWENAIETFERLRRVFGLKTYLGMTLSKYNFDKMGQTVEEVKEKLSWISYSDFHINIAHYSSHFYGNIEEEFAPPSDELIGEIYRFIKLRGMPVTPIQYLERRYLGLIEKYLNTKEIPLPCQALNASCFLDAEGNVFPCSIFDRKIGNLRQFDYNLEIIWNLPACDKIREEISTHKCPDCWTPCEAYQTILGSMLRRWKN